MADHAHVRKIEASTNTAGTATSVTALPILKFSQRALLDLEQRASTSLNHIARVVEFDPNLTVSLFLAVNRDLDNHGKDPVASVSRALLIFGTARFLEHAPLFKTIEDTRNERWEGTVRTKLARSYLTGRLAQALATLARGHNHADAFAMAVCSDAVRYARKLITVTNSTLSARHFALYLPGLGENAVINEDLLEIVAVSRKFARQVSECWDEAALIPLYERAAELCGREPDDVERVLKRTSVDAARSSRHFNCPLAATNLMSPGSRSVTHRARKETLPSPQLQKPPPDTPPVDRIVRALNAATDAVYSIEECRNRVGRAVRDLEKIGFSDGGRTRIIPYALQTMSAILPIEQAMFITNDRNDTLSIRIKFSAEKQPVSCNIPIDRQANPFIERVISDNTAYKFNTRSEETLNGELDKTLNRFIGDNVGYFFPMVVGRPFGLIIAEVDRDLDRQDFSYFELFLALATQATKSIGLATARSKAS